MSSIPYALSRLLFPVINEAGVGTNIGLYHLNLALVSGRFLRSRGAVVSALDDLGLPPQAVRRAQAALAYGKWSIQACIKAWRNHILQEGQWRSHRFGGYRPVACDLVGFYRPRLKGCVGKHYTSKAGKALPALVCAMVADVGVLGKKRLPLLRQLLRQEADESEPQLQARLLKEVGSTLAKDEVLVCDSGFDLKMLLESVPTGFVVRLAVNDTARRNVVAASTGQGRPPEYGKIVRPLARTYNGKTIEATPADATARWKDGRHNVRAHIFDNLVAADAKPGAATYQIVVILDARYAKPLVIASNLVLSAYDLWRIYKDRWPVEQMPLAAKQMLGCERAFVFSEESRWRLPELALLAGNVVSYLAATQEPVSSGFWDRAARPTCGRQRRVLGRLSYSDFPCPWGEVRKKCTVTEHLKTGVSAHRRVPKARTLFQTEQAVC